MTKPMLGEATPETKKELIVELLKNELDRTQEIQETVEQKINYLCKNKIIINKAQIIIELLLNGEKTGNQIYNDNKEMYQKIMEEFKRIST